MSGVKNPDHMDVAELITCFRIEYVLNVHIKKKPCRKTIIRSLTQLTDFFC
jgi:hypothetical protein